MKLYIIMANDMVFEVWDTEQEANERLKFLEENENEKRKNNRFRNYVYYRCHIRTLNKKLKPL